MSNLAKVLKEFEKDQLEEEKDHENDDDVTGAVLTENDKSHYQSVEKSNLRPVVVGQKYTGTIFVAVACYLFYLLGVKVTREQLEASSDESGDDEDGDVDEDEDDDEEALLNKMKREINEKKNDANDEEEEEDYTKLFAVQDDEDDDGEDGDDNDEQESDDDGDEEKDVDEGKNLITFFSIDKLFLRVGRR